MLKDTLRAEYIALNIVLAGLYSFILHRLESW
jgi:hypothetical protein